MKPKYIAILVLLLLAAGVVFWYEKIHQPKPQVFAPKEQQPAAQSLGAQVYEQQQNPVQGQIPSSNPFDNSSNPISNTYKNPFQ